MLVLKRNEKADFFDTTIMRAVEDFGSPWPDNNDMTFHGPLAGACLFEPQLCEYERGTIDVDIKNDRRLGMMRYQANPKGNSEIATAVNRDTFFEHYYSITLTNTKDKFRKS